jgi:asparagine synthase (glutamine-hydrolysing)
MCGIAGIFEYDASAKPQRRVLERMTQLLAHRGPDDVGYLEQGSVALGHRRLSIIDLSPAGHQPMANEDESIWIVYNGECYNYLDLARSLKAQGVRLRSQSDTEVLLRLYEQRGERFLQDLQGMFALAIWDSRRQTLIVARDRIGVKPLFYFSDRRHLLFASEMKALLADPAVPCELDIAALGDFLHLLSIPDPRSILKGVAKVMPGHYLRVTREGPTEVPYWDLQVALDERMTFDEACSGFDRRFHAAVSSHMVSDVPVGAFLSGGVDSSSIVAVAQRSAREPIQTFSIVFPGLEEFDESVFAARAATHCGVRHNEFNLTPNLIDVLPRIAWHADEPFAVSSAFALYFLAQLAREHVKVVLSGDGSDELFAGYVWRHADFPPASALHRSRTARTAAKVLQYSPLRKRLPERIRSRLPECLGQDQRYLRSMTCYDDDELSALLEPGYASQIEKAWRSNITQRYLDTAPGDEQLVRKLYTDVKSTLVSEMLTKVDRMTMAHGLEARVPFLDHRLVEWAFTVPGRHKLQAGEGKLLVKKAMEKNLPRENLYRPKQGFNVPLKLWLRDELREFIVDQLAPARMARRGMFRPAQVSALLKGHFTGKIEASNRIFVLLMLELWTQQFADRRASFLAE